MTAPEPPVAVTVAVPVSDGEGTIEVTVVLTARRVIGWAGDEPADEPEPEPEPAPQGRPSAVFGGGRIQGIAPPSQ